MLISTKTRLRIFSLTILGTIVGSLGGFWIGRAALLRTAKADLTDYAHELSSSADKLSDEINAILHLEDTPGVRLCSNRDLTELQAQTFRTVHVKDIGRTHDGKLYCSAFLGRLAHPYIEGPPSLVLDTGANVYTHVAVLIGSRGGDDGTIVEAGDIDVVLNSNALGNWDRPHVSYMVVAFNRQTGQVSQIAGSVLEIEPAWVLSHSSEIFQGNIYRSVCSNKYAVCVVTAERLADVWNLTFSAQIAYSAMGGFVGLSLGLVTALLYSRSRSLSNQLLRAVRKNSSSLLLLYQPILDVGTGRCMGAEALLRWTDQNGVSVSPEVFIPIAEEKGFINELTALVLRRATLEVGDMLRNREDFTLSVNVSASEMCDERLFELLRDHVHRARIAPGRVALELTERSTADLTVVSAAIQRLRGEGYKAYIDDFGTGFSSLSYIDQLQVNTIKIDRAFTRTIGTEAMLAPILAQMVTMANSLGMEIIVEGVETEVQRDYLAAIDKNLRAQGWYFSRPLTAEAFRLFEAQNKATQPSISIQRAAKPLSLEAFATTEVSNRVRAGDWSDDLRESSALAGVLALASSLAPLSKSHP